MISFVCKFTKIALFHRCFSVIFLTAILKNTCNFTSSFSLKPHEFLVSTSLHYPKRSSLAKVESVLESTVLESIQSKIIPYKKLAFHPKVSLSILTLLFDKYVHKAIIICVRNVQTMCNKKPKPWSKISGRESGSLELDL